MDQSTPFSLSFQDVSFEVPIKSTNPFSPKTQWKKILHNISGHVGPGEFLGILGPSGAGKSSLLNLLAARSSHPPSSGSILFNGKPRIPRTKRYIGYVMQDDVFFNKLTVRETLQFTADIRLPKTFTKQQRKEYVDKLIDTVGLTNCQNTRIGDAFEKGISGGERKRLNIANELIHQPSLFLADECTSGLDSSSAMTILNVLDRLKQQGRTVVISIHQPSSKMFLLFTNILLLANGRVAYFGKPHNVIRYFESLDFPFPKTAYNPADYILELIIDNNITDDVKQSPQQKILDAWATNPRNTNYIHEDTCAKLESSSTDEDTSHQNVQSSSQHVVVNMDRNDTTDHQLEKNSGEDTSEDMNVMKDDLESNLKIYDRKPPGSHMQRMGRAVTKRMNNVIGKDDHTDVKYTTDWFTQVGALMRRSARQKQGILIQGTAIAQVIITTVLLLTFWFRMEPTEGRIEDRLGFLSFVGVNWGFYSVTSSIFSFPIERSVLTKDRANGVYRLSAYYVAKTLVEIPADTIYPLGSCLVLYYAAGLNPDVRAYALFCLFSVLNTLIGQSIGLFASAILMNVRQSLVLGSSWVLASLMVSGFVIDPNNIPSPIRFIRDLSFLRYAYEALIRTEFLFGRVFECETDPTLQTIYSENGKVCPITEEQLLKAARLSNTLPLWGYVLVQVAWIVGLRFLSYFALKLLHTTHKPKLSTWRT